MGLAETKRELNGEDRICQIQYFFAKSTNHRLAANFGVLMSSTLEYVLFFHFVGASVNAGSARRWLRHVFRSDGKVCSKVIIVETYFLFHMMD